MSLFDDTINALQAHIEDIEAQNRALRAELDNLNDQVVKLTSEGSVIIDQLKDIVKYHDNF